MIKKVYIHCWLEVWRKGRDDDNDNMFCNRYFQDSIQSILLILWEKLEEIKKKKVVGASSNRSRRRNDDEIIKNKEIDLDDDVLY